MGSSGSRPRLCRVAPCNNSLQENEEQPEPQWTLPALPFTLEQSLGSAGHRKTTLPPLKQEIRLPTLSEPCFAENFQPKQTNNSSIIHSHPPQRPQALQPLALPIGHSSTADHIAMSRECRDGAVHRYSTSCQTGISGTGRTIQFQGGFLEAQTALTQQAHRQRRAHLRQAREQRRHKIVYAVNVGNTEGIQRLKLVRRPTEKDIFWDEKTGEHLDPDCLLDPKCLPHLGEERQHNPTNSSRAMEKKGSIKRVEDNGRTQRDSWMGPESARSHREDKRCKRDLGL